MAQNLFKAADILTVWCLGGCARHHDLHHVGVARHTCPAKCDPHAVLRHDTLCSSRPRRYRRSHHARLRAVVAQPRGRTPRRAGEGYDKHEPVDVAAQEQSARERATIASEFDPAEIIHGRDAAGAPSVLVAFLPLIVVILVYLAMSFVVLPRLDTSYLAEARWGETSLAAVGGVWAVVVALFTAILTLIAFNFRRLPSLRESVDAGANASVLPAFSVSSLVGFGTVVAALPAFALVRIGCCQSTAVRSSRSPSPPIFSPR